MVHPSHHNKVKSTTGTGLIALFVKSTKGERPRRGMGSIVLFMYDVGNGLYIISLFMALSCLGVTKMFLPKTFSVFAISV